MYPRKGQTLLLKVVCYIDMSLYQNRQANAYKAFCAKVRNVSLCSKKLFYFFSFIRTNGLLLPLFEHFLRK